MIITKIKLIVSQTKIFLSLYARFADINSIVQFCLSQHRFKQKSLSWLFFLEMNYKLDYALHSVR